MPAPVPPPPPLPTEDETRRAVQLVRALALVAVAFFFAVASTVGPDASMVDVARSNGTSWMLWKLRHLDEGMLRAHPGGRVVWLVGSSILREALDEDALNAQLAAHDSPWRVAKFGQTRGAPGLSWGVLRRLPVRAGDLVLVNVAVDNLRRDWVNFSGLEPARFAMVLDARELWAIDTWSVQERLELAMGVPRNFWSYRDEAMKGWTAMLAAPFTGAWPEPRTTSRQLTFYVGRADRAPTMKATKDPERSGLYLDADALDVAPTQFNLAALERMRSWTSDRGAQLVVADIPPRQEYALFLSPAVAAAWEAWKHDQPWLLRFPQVPSDHYYDYRHVGDRGREAMTGFLVGWLRAGPPQPANALASRPTEWEMSP